MKLQKKIVTLVAMIFTVNSTAFLIGSQIKNYSQYDYNRLMKTAAEKGFVRVIVKFYVPRIEILTAVSTKYKTGHRKLGFMQRAYDADLALDEAISTSRRALLHHMNRSIYRINRIFSTIPFVALTVTGETLEGLKSLPGVLKITEDKLTRLPTAGQYDLGSPFLNRSTEIVGADVAWGFGFSGEGWYVAVLDTGILGSHQMFHGKHIIEHCFALGGDFFDRENGSCPNGGIEMDGPGSAAHYQPRFGHGSHVTGIAAGNDNDSHFGVARGADIIAVQVFSYFPSEDEVLSWNSDQIAGLEYVYTLRNTYNIAAVNMSLGGGEYFNFCDSDARADAISNLRAAGIATIVSAGNEAKCGAVASPACVPGAVAVSGTDKEDNAINYGNWHDEMVDLLAPGASINSADGLGDNSYRNRSGTSMSAPHVAGAWAIMKGFDESLSVDDILSIFQDTGSMIPGPYHCQNLAPKARLHIGDALISLFSIAPPANLVAVQETNRSFLQTEYVNVLTWESNPLNADKNITNYRIYRVGDGNQLIRLAEVNSSTFTYWHRNVGKRETTTYAVTASDDKGEESSPYYFYLDFGVIQN